MKHLIYLFSLLLFTSFTVNAENTNNLKTLESNATTSYRGYGKSFIFMEQGIEFSVYADGQFDFYMPNRGPQVNVSVGTPNVNISFNSGYNYDAYVQYDEFGAIIQIENTPIFYDYYGRIIQAGDIYINYNNRGYVTRVGGLYIHYNRYNVFSHYTGFINVYNRAYVFRPWHRYYAVPSVNYCVVFNRPYRQYYTPIRYKYNRPYTNNYRRKTAVASRRGNTITRNRSYASRTEGRTRLAATPRARTRNSLSNSTPRTRSNTSTTTRTRVKTTSTPRTRSNATPKTRTRTNTVSSTPRTNRSVTKNTATRTRTRNSSASTPRTSSNRTAQRSTKKVQNRVASTSRNTKSSSKRTSTNRSRR
ncbi:hypothetical protein CLV86_0179 [Lacinutrix venerupis]|uniref:hypothetical protein n=1 Tax=Lacinutrix venerupis TaxID=1486034 RepID=UPI000EB5964E|nr:hypothetical protein [Lacinutrix venerupis]RLJ68790.1 hypothetical protein CLV86_0179 [Lacinutrix venerupis]